MARKIEVLTRDGHPAVIEFDGTRELVLATFYGKKHVAEFNAGLFAAAVESSDALHARSEIRGREGAALQHDEIESKARELRSAIEGHPLSYPFTASNRLRELELRAKDMATQIRAGEAAVKS